MVIDRSLLRINSIYATNLTNVHPEIVDIAVKHKNTAVTLPPASEKN